MHATRRWPLIKAQNATLALLPSIWPETWCFALGEAWRAGLRVVAFDIGAPGRTHPRHGPWILLPLGLPPHAINNALMAAVSVCHNANHSANFVAYIAHLRRRVYTFSRTRTYNQQERDPHV